MIQFRIAVPCSGWRGDGWEVLRETSCILNHVAHVSCYREGWVLGRAEQPPRIRVLLLLLLLPAPDGVIPAVSGRG